MRPVSTGLSKSRITAFLQCPKRLWLQTYKPESSDEDPNAVRVMAAGTQAGEIARDMFPDGMRVRLGFTEELRSEEVQGCIDNTKKYDRNSF